MADKALPRSGPGHDLVPVAWPEDSLAEIAASIGVNHSGGRQLVASMLSQAAFEHLAEITSSTRQKALGAPGPLDVLTPRQRQVAVLMTAGRANKEIARLLGLSMGRTKRIASIVLVKFGVRTRTQVGVIVKGWLDQLQSH